MTTISFPCDRCGEPITGIHTEDCTGGFYIVDAGGTWAQYGRPGEHFVCDACVHATPEYQPVYGRTSGTAHHVKSMAKTVLAIAAEQRAGLAHLELSGTDGATALETLRDAAEGARLS